MTSHNVFQVVKAEVLVVIDNWPAVILSVGHGKEIDEEHNKSCVEEGFQFTWANLW